jgi:hypothetical protein
MLHLVLKDHGGKIVEVMHRNWGESLHFFCKSVDSCAFIECD